MVGSGWRDWCPRRGCRWVLAVTVGIVFANRLVTGHAAGLRSVRGQSIQHHLVMMMLMESTTEGRGRCLGSGRSAVGGWTIPLASRSARWVVVVRGSWRGGGHGNGPLLLHEAMQFEPVGSATISGAGFGHSDQEALAQSTGFAGRPVLFVDNALTAILAFWDHREIVVRSTEERLQLKEKKNKLINFHSNSFKFAFLTVHEPSFVRCTYHRLTRLIRSLRSTVCFSLCVFAGHIRV